MLKFIVILLASTIFAVAPGASYQPNGTISSNFALAANLSGGGLPGQFFSSIPESVLYRFRIGNDGFHPYAAPIADNLGNLYGTTSSGGGGGANGGQGVVYKLVPFGSAYNEYILYRFHGPDGALPQAGVIADSSGALYGTTTAGGANGEGTVFKLTPTGNTYSESILYSFRGGSDGFGPVSSLIADSSGALYGTTPSGGAAGLGTVYKLTRSGNSYTESILYSFQGGSDGAGPYSALLADSTGALYGTTSAGGAAGLGAVYKLSLNGINYSESLLYSFQPGSDCSSPTGSPIADSNGDLFGTTSGGGTAGQGCIYSLTPNGNGYSESVLYSFLRGTDGASPYAALILDNNGALYGTTIGGGTVNQGTVFKLTPGFNGYAENILYRFVGGADGANPFSALIFDNSGALYGTTYGLNNNNPGTVFKLTPNGMTFNESVPHLFRLQADGEQPQAALIADSTGGLYGTTSIGGAFRQGTVFKLSPTRNGYSETLLYSFPGTPDGANPLAGVIADSGGALYGTTSGGGAYGFGSVFKLTPSGTGYSESVLYSFHNGSDGATPRASLLASGTGTLYGTTANGGSPDQGTVFELIPNGGGYNYSILYTFAQYSGDGSSPWSALITDSTGALYGTTAFGGGLGFGSVYRLTPNGGGYNENILYSFAGLADGSRPQAGLIEDSSGSLYGTTLGNRGCLGTVFKLTPGGGGYVHSVLHLFKTAGGGAYPMASLIADSAGALYGTTEGGGASGFGTVFKLSPIGSGYSKTILYNFHGGVDGANPFAALIADNSGAIYGTTYAGGKLGQGTIFKLRP